MMLKLGVVVAIGWSLLSCSEPTNYIAGDGIQNPTQSAPTQPPNIVLIVADDLGYGDISPYGGWIKTLNLEQLAQTGVQFSDFHASGNVCSPTRAGLMTGLYQQRLGIPGVLFADPARPEHYEGIAAAHTTIAEVLQQHGYATAIFGKWHLGYQAQHNPTLHGFDEFRGFVSGNLDYQSHIDMMGRADWWHNDKLQAEEGYLTDLLTDHAVRFIEENTDRPFFLYLPHHAPHFPFQGRNDPADRSIGGDFESRGSAEDPKRAYREMVEAVDEGIGKIVAALNEQGIAENTVVWFFSDNGAIALGSNQPLRGTKATDWEGGHRVPSILSWPGKLTPQRSAALSSTLDVMPTVLGWAGIEYPGDFDGIDLGPAIEARETTSNRQLFWGGDGFFWQGSAVREGRYKLLIDQSPGADGVPQLFDLSQDIGEQNNIAAENAVRVDRLFNALQRWKKAVGVAVPAR